MKISSKKEGDKGLKAAASEAKKQGKQLEDDFKKDLNGLHEHLTENLSNILLGEKIPTGCHELRDG